MTFYSSTVVFGYPISSIYICLGHLQARPWVDLEIGTLKPVGTFHKHLET